MVIFYSSRQKMRSSLTSHVAKDFGPTAAQGRRYARSIDPAVIAAQREAKAIVRGFMSLAMEMAEA
jgi:hypothetical protein